MLNQIPQIIKIYRIVHIDNIEYLLSNGIFTRNYHQTDSNYVNIGDSGLIIQRNDYPVGINPPNGILGDYVPFYFGPLSPMLLNIKTGYRGITKREQSEIIYICCTFNDIEKHCNEWCFTDGHAKTRITEFYNDAIHFDKVDWNMVSEKYWTPNDEDNDRMRRKQAEFLVKFHVPVKCINSIIVLNEDVKTNIIEIIERLSLKIPVLINPKSHFYY
jgi:hypothetical protein